MHSTHIHPDEDANHIAVFFKKRESNSQPTVASILFQ
jgi:hypothetical protein